MGDEIGVRDWRGTRHGGRMLWGLVKDLLLVAVVLVPGGLFMAAHAQAATAKVNCFGGPGVRNPPDPGDTCWTGGLALSIPKHGHPADTGWNLTSHSEAGVRYLVLGRVLTRLTGEWKITFVGWVRSTGGLGGGGWPWRHPAENQAHAGWPVLQVQWFSPAGNPRGAPQCISDISIAAFQQTALGPCGKSGQGHRDTHATYLVWKPGQRFLEVNLQNASPGGEHEFCLTALKLARGAAVDNLHPSTPHEHLQQWHLHVLPIIV